jgi:hypothetical protein
LVRYFLHMFNHFMFLGEVIANYQKDPSDQLDFTRAFYYRQLIYGFLVLKI